MSQIPCSGEWHIVGRGGAHGWQWKVWLHSWKQWWLQAGGGDPYRAEWVGMVAFHGVDALKCVETIQMHVKLWMNNHDFWVICLWLSRTIQTVTNLNLILYRPCIIIHHVESPTRFTFSYIFILKFLYSTCIEQIYRSSSGVYKALYMQLFVHIMLTVTSCLASSVGTGIG